MMAQPNGHSDAATYTEERLAGGVPYTEERLYRAPNAPTERPLGEVFQELAQDARNLVSLEIALAKVELSEKVSQAGKAAGVMAAGGFILYAGFLAMIFAVIVVLSYLIPLWLSALLVGIVVALIGYALVRKGQNDMKPEKLMPRQTIDTLREDKEWAQKQVH